MLKRLCRDTDEPLRVSFTRHQVQNSGLTHALSPISLSFFFHHHLSPIERLSPLVLFVQMHTRAFAPGPKTLHRHPRLVNPPATGLTAGQPYIHCAAGPQKESPSEAPWRRHGLMLRDSSCLFKWQRCKDSRRQPYRQQDPPDYFVSDIKRSGYTEWERSRAGAASAATITLTRL